MELAARIDALSIELEQRHEELKRHITQTVEHAIVPLLQHVEANSAHGSRCSSRTVSRAASCARTSPSERATEAEAQAPACSQALDLGDI